MSITSDGMIGNPEVTGEMEYVIDPHYLEANVFRVFNIASGDRLLVSRESRIPGVPESYVPENLLVFRHKDEFVHLKTQNGSCLGRACAGETLWSQEDDGRCFGFKVVGVVSERQEVYYTLVYPKLLKHGDIYPLDISEANKLSKETPAGCTN
mgnify:CR=1 FL=1